MSSLGDALDECAALRVQLAAAREEGRCEERADVVKWLWGCARFARAAGGEAMALRASALEDEAEAIERGDHVGAAGKKGKL